MKVLILINKDKEVDINPGLNPNISQIEEIVNKNEIVDNSEIVENSDNREYYKLIYYKVMSADICTLRELWNSLYYLRNVNTKKGFFNDKLEEIMKPIYELREYPSEMQKEINNMIGKENNIYNDIFNDFLILKHIEKISMLIEKGIIKENEEENEKDGTILDVNYILKDFVNSLTDKTRLRFTVPKISISKRNMTYIATKSISIDHDRREYEEAYGLMKIIPIVTIIKAKNHEQGEIITTLTTTTRENELKEPKEPKLFIWMKEKNEQILDRITWNKEDSMIIENSIMPIMEEVSMKYYKGNDIIYQMNKEFSSYSCKLEIDKNKYNLRNHIEILLKNQIINKEEKYDKTIEEIRKALKPLLSGNKRAIFDITNKEEYLTNNIQVIKEMYELVAGISEFDKYFNKLRNRSITLVSDNYTLTGYEDFNEIKKDLTIIRKYITSISKTPMMRINGRITKVKVRNIELLNGSQTAKIVDMNKPKEIVTYKDEYINSLIKMSVLLTGKGEIPLTISSLGADIVMKTRKDKGIKMLTYVNEKGKRPLITTKEMEFKGDKIRLMNILKMSYKGGRNECFAYGTLMTTPLYDYDLRNAYTTALAMVGVPDWENTKIITDVKNIQEYTQEDYLKKGYLVAELEFEFPDDTLYPNFPVLISDDLFCFPLRGKTVTGGPEICAALKRGVKIVHIFAAYYIPFEDNGVKPFYDSINLLQEQRRNYSRETLENYILKLILNSIYGMTASGLNPKTRYNTITNNTEEAYYESILSCPYSASYTTSMIRGVISEQLNALESINSLVLSITTDGWICDTPPDKIHILKYAGSCTNIYAQSRLSLSGSDDYLELKHTCKGLINITVRGQLGLDDDSLISVKAMTGFQHKYWDAIHLHSSISEIIADDNNWDKFLSFTHSEVRSLSDLFRKGGQLGNEVTVRNYRVKIDNRRSIDIDNYISDQPSSKHKLWLTRPFHNSDECIRARNLSKTCLHRYAPNSLYIPSGENLKYTHILLRQFVRIIIWGKFGGDKTKLKNCDIIKKIHDVTCINVSRQFVSDQRKREPNPYSVPLTSETAALYKILVGNFEEAKNIEAQYIFTKDTWISLSYILY